MSDFVGVRVLADGLSPCPNPLSRGFPPLHRMQVVLFRDGQPLPERRLAGNPHSGGRHRPANVKCPRCVHGPSRWRDPGGVHTSQRQHLRTQYRACPFRLIWAKRRSRSATFDTYLCIASTVPISFAAAANSALRRPVMIRTHLFTNASLSPGQCRYSTAG
jgi:hypothetical protein